jgi:hypothetical protein
MKSLGEHLLCAGGRDCEVVSQVRPSASEFAFFTSSFAGNQPGDQDVFPSCPNPTVLLKMLSFVIETGGIGHPLIAGHMAIPCTCPRLEAR